MQGVQPWANLPCMNTALDTFLRSSMTGESLAKALGVSSVTVSHWRHGLKFPSPRRCAEIERLTQGEVRRWHLRPLDWHLIWPELVGVDGAPDVPDNVEVT